MKQWIAVLLLVSVAGCGGVPFGEEKNLSPPSVINSEISSALSNSPQVPLTSKILFTSNRPLDGSNNLIEAANIWIVNEDGSSAKPITALFRFRAYSGSPEWSPNKREIVFVSNRALDGSDNAIRGQNIWVSNADGTQAKPLTRMSRTYSSTPHWFPDGRKVVFVSNRALDGSDATTNANNLWIVNADGSGAAALAPLTEGNVDTNEPQWSPDGSKIVFNSNRDLQGQLGVLGNFNIWVINVDGIDLTPMINPLDIEAFNIMPQWSPDSRRILFVSNHAFGSLSDEYGGELNLCVINVDGSEFRALTTLYRASQGRPQWSPDGTKIVFASSRVLDGSDDVNGASNIWIMNADGNDPRPLTQFINSSTSNEPQWFPDGSKILFGSDLPLDGSDGRQDRVNLWVVHADGTGLRLLTTR